MYLDKPMRNHTLMQTIARANRVFPGKHSGVIVDYANVFASLESALAIYGAGTGGSNPVKDKARLVAALSDAVSAATAFCASNGVDWFKDSKHKNTDLEALKAAIRAKLGTLLRLNRTRADYAEQFEALIESYNAGSRSIEQLFDELLRLSNTLDDEQVRHVREQLTEEELVIIDILTRPAPELSAEERAGSRRDRGR